MQVRLDARGASDRADLTVGATRWPAVAGGENEERAVAHQAIEPSDVGVLLVGGAMVFVAVLLDALLAFRTFGGETVVEDLDAVPEQVVPGVECGFVGDVAGPRADVGRIEVGIGRNAAAIRVGVLSGQYQATEVPCLPWRLGSG